jgi:aryl-alcohol dehydrogenase-like predicted oxidoreductase
MPEPMKTRQLGRGGPSVSAIGFGCMVISGSYGTPDEEAGIRAIHRALELGVTFFDTADVYGHGTHSNETLVGRALKGRRDSVVLASKCGLLSPTDPGGKRVDGSRKHIREACERSLRALNVSTIDLYYLHRVDPEVPVEESVGAMAELVDEGKVRFLGLSEVHPNTLRRAHKVHPITAVQSEYSLWTRDPEHGILETCRELGVGFVPFSPLGRGFLSGGLRTLDGLPADDFRRGLPRFQGANLGWNLELVDHLAELAKSKGCTPSQLALAWLLYRGPDVVPIPGTKNPRHVEENVAAGDVTLSPSDLREIEDAVGPEKVAGERYSPDRMALVDRGHSSTAR